MNRARDFLIQWLSKEMRRPFGEPPFSENHARLYVARLLGDAERKGFKRGDLEKEVGILEDFMLGELDQSPARRRHS